MNIKCFILFCKCKKNKIIIWNFRIHTENKVPNIDSISIQSYGLDYTFRVPYFPVYKYKYF